MYKNKKYDNDGMTLIEVIISMAILGIIAVAFLHIFASGFIGVLSSGKRTEVGYEAQQSVEEALNSSSNGTDKVTIIFPDGPSVEVYGSIIVEEVNNGKENIKITTFKPNP